MRACKHHNYGTTGVALVRYVPLPHHLVTTGQQDGVDGVIGTNHALLLPTALGDAHTAHLKQQLPHLIGCRHFKRNLYEIR